MQHVLWAAEAESWYSNVMQQALMDLTHISLMASFIHNCCYNHMSSNMAGMVIHMDRSTFNFTIWLDSLLLWFDTTEDSQWTSASTVKLVTLCEHQWCIHCTPSQHHFSISGYYNSQYTMAIEQVEEDDTVSPSQTGIYQSQITKWFLFINHNV